MAVHANPSAPSACDRPRTSVAVAVVSVGVLAALLLLSGVLSVGERLGRLHPALAGVFYAAALALVAVGIVVPVVKVASHPVFSLYLLRDDQGRPRRSWCRRLADGLLAGDALDEAEREQLREAIASNQGLDDLLVELFHRRVVPAIDSETKRAARTAFAATAVSQSPLVDAATMLWINFDLVRSIVEACGFRPSNLALIRLYARVMASSLIAGGLEDMDLESLLAGVMGGGGGAKASGVVVASAAQGFVNAFLVFRVGSITKGYLCAEDAPARMADLRRSSYKDALATMKTSGFVSEMLVLVKERATQAASYVADTVKTAAQEATRSARDTANAALESMGRAVKTSPLGHVFKSPPRESAALGDGE